MDRVTAGPTGEAAAPRAAEVLVLPAAVRSDVARRAVVACPAEACGVLVGRVEEARRRVERAVPAENRQAERHDRYLVDPGTLRRLLEEEDAGGPSVLGFWHSHPGAPPRPSRTDRERAWPWYHYLIVPVHGDGDGRWRAGRGRAWELDPTTRRFVERPVHVG